MTDDRPSTAALTATLLGVLKVCHALAKDRDAIEGGTGWRAELEAQLILTAKRGAGFEGFPIDREPVLYEMIFAGIKMGLTVDENYKARGPNLDHD